MVYNIPMCCISPRWGCMLIGALCAFAVAMDFLACTDFASDLSMGGWGQCPHVENGSWFRLVLSILKIGLAVAFAVFCLWGAVAEDQDKMKFAVIIWAIYIGMMIPRHLVNVGLNDVLRHVGNNSYYVWMTLVIVLYWVETGGSIGPLSGLEYCPMDQVV